jgi:hypothetical protein
MQVIAGACDSKIHGVFIRVTTGISNNRWTMPLISLLVALTCGAWSVIRGQDMNWDLLNYHLYNPYAFLNDRIQLDLAPAGAQTYFSPMLDIAYFKAIWSLGPKAVGFLIGFLQGLNFLLVWGIAQTVLGGRPKHGFHALALALAGVLCIGFLAEVGTTMQDSLVALLPLLSLWLMLSSIGALTSEGQRRVLGGIIAAGAIAGVGIGLKLVMAIYALPLCLALLVLPLPWSERFKLAFLFGFSVLAGLLVTGGYWLYEIWRQFGNPLFPQFNDIFHAELALPLPSRDLRYIPRTLFDKIFFPVIFTIDPLRTVELQYRQYSWLVAYIAIIGLFANRLTRLFRKTAVRDRWNPQALYLLVFFCTSYLLWLNIFGIYRYLIVIELLIPLLLFMIITRLFRHRLAPAAALVFLALLTIVNLRSIPDWGHSSWAQTVYHIEANALQTDQEPAAVYLAGQPIAWLVPALDIRSPFIHVTPNMFPSDAYWQRARILTADRPGKRFIIYESEDAELQKRAREALGKLGLSVDEEICSHITAYLGTAGFVYRFCELENTESQ